MVPYFLLAQKVTGQAGFRPLEAAAAAVEAAPQIWTLDLLHS